MRKLTQILDEAGAAARFARDTGISAMQDEPVMRVQEEFLGNEAYQSLFNL